MVQEVVQYGDLGKVVFGLKVILEEFELPF